MRTLLAEILNNEAVSPIALSVTLPGVRAFRPKVEISSNLYPRHGWTGFSIVELGAGQFAPLAAYTFRGICYHKPGCLIHNDERRLFCSSCRGGGNGNNHSSGHEQKCTPRKGMA